MSGIDDFFAKKDRKKKSNKGFSKANADVLIKRLEENDRKEQQAEDKANNACTVASTYEDSFLVDDNEKEEEWLDYDDSKKDYTDLKIETLKIDSANEGANGENMDEYTEEEQLNEAGAKVWVKKSDGGPWNKSNVNSVLGSVTDSVDSRDSIVEVETKKSGGGVYVAPQLRRGNNSATVSRPQVGMGQRRFKQAPNINSELNFPSLSAASIDMDFMKNDRNSAAFEEVRGGGNYVSSPSHCKITLDNKFNVLS